ncbi:MAG: glycosyltransferase family 4 protein, partial [Anaerolineales bacterium]|nr:glycosyltransferase family 4 protein [Anaerolineales bacterium]
AFAAIDEPGGTRHHELARHLAAHGHRVTVITSPISYLTGKEQTGRGKQVERVSARGDSAASPAGEVTILRTYVYPALHRSFVHRVLNFFSFMAASFLAGLTVRQVDLVWGTSPPIFQGLTAWLLAGLKRTPFLFEVRDLWPAFAVQVGVLRQPLLIRASEALEGFLYRRAGQVLVNSPGFVEHVLQRGGRRVEVVPNGADMGMFPAQAQRDEFRRAQGLEGKFVVLYAGAHGLSNDLGVALQAAAMLKDRAEIVFVFLGDGKEKPALQEQAARLGLANVRFLPPLAKQDMAPALAAADACLAILKPVPLYATVYPNKVFDYMAAGKAVILAIPGVIRQVVEEAGAGIAIPPGDATALADAVRRLAGDAELTRRMGERGRACVEARFNRVDLAERFRNVVEEMAAQKRR